MTNNLSDFNNDEFRNEHILPYKEKIDNFIAEASTIDLKTVEAIAADALSRNEIPKIIHFCFVNYKDIPDIYYHFFNRWLEVFPDYVFVNWTPENLPGNKYTERCLADKKWAFYADYARTYAVYRYGGFYMDCDIWVYRSFDSLLHLPYIFDIEHSYLTTIDKRPRLEAGIFGARAGNPFIGLMESVYRSLEPDDHFDYGYMVAPFLWAHIAPQAGFEIVYNNGDINDLETFFSENTDPKRFATLDGTYFSKIETDLPNRFILGERSGIREQHHEDQAYTSHQFLSNWC